MKILSFVEGAQMKTDGMVLGGVPQICQALADRGHYMVLNVGGQPTLGSEHLVRQSAGSIFQAVGDNNKFGIVSYPAYGRWTFAPTLFWKLGHHIKDTDFVMLHSLYSFPVLAGYILAQLNKKPYGVWPHGVLAPVQRSVGVRKKWIYDRMIARRILVQASVLFYSAIGEREETRPLNFTAPSVITPEGIDTSEYSQLPARGQFRAKYFNGHRGPLVLYLGRLNAKKGLDLLVESMTQVVKHMPDVRLAIVGGGDPPKFADQIKEWLCLHGIEDRTVMTGVLTGQAKLAAFADADVFVIPSHAENFCFTMFEAMASRVPVVVSDNLNYATEVKRYEAGFVVRRDPREFATAMLALLVDEDCRKRMGENGLQLAQSYSWQNCGERVERAIACVLHGIPFPADLTLQ